MRALQVPHIGLLEHPRPWADRFQLAPDGHQQVRRQDPRRTGGLICVLGKDVPAAEDQVRQVGQRHQVLDAHEPGVRAFAEAQLLQLGERAIGPGQTFTHEMDASDEGGGHRPQTRQQYP
jgi:hypothetical protein